MLLEVVDNLFLGDKNTVKEQSKLDRDGFSLVVTAAGGVGLQLPDGFTHVRLHVRDNGEDSLLPELDTVVELIDKHLSRGDKVLVHCMAGLSRSPAVIMAYPIRYRRLTVEEALDVVRRVRPRARPRGRLMEDLDTYFDQWSVGER